MAFCVFQKDLSALRNYPSDKKQNAWGRKEAQIHLKVLPATSGTFSKA